MENKQLTSDELQRVFFMYFGSDAIYIDGAPLEGRKVTLTMSSIYYYRDCKLLLKSIENISYKDAVEVAKYLPVHYGDIPALIKWLEVTILTNKISWQAYQYLVLNDYAVPLYLGIDHWANGKTAIELNIAIETSSQLTK